jgi:hypothetical protein
MQMKLVKSSLRCKVSKLETVVNFYSHLIESNDRAVWRTIYFCQGNM